MTVIIKRRRRHHRAPTLSGSLRRFLAGFTYWLAAGIVMGVFGLAKQAVGPLELTLGNTTYDFSFVVSLMGLGLGAFLLFKGARYVGVRI